MSAQGINLELRQKYGLVGDQFSSSYAPLIDEAEEIKANFSDAVSVYVQAAAAYDAMAKQIESNAQQLKQANKQLQAFDTLHGFLLNEERARLLQAITAAERNEEALKKKLLAQQNELAKKLDAMCDAYATLAPKLPNTDSTDIPRALDDGTRAVFLINGLFLAATLAVAPTLGLAIATAAMGSAWNYWDGGAGFASISHSEDRTSTRDKIWDGIQSASNAQLLLATTINSAYFLFEVVAKMGSPLASTVIANAPAALGFLNGPSFALCMGLSAANEIDNALEARRKSKDPSYFAQTCREAATAELDLLLHPRQTLLEKLKSEPARKPTMEQFVKANERIKRLTADADALQYYAEYETKDEVAQKIELNKTENRHNVIHAKLLMERQEEKAKEHAIKAGVWSLATFAMTAAVFAMPPSVVISVLMVGVTKMIQTVASRIADDYNQEAVAYAQTEQQKPRCDGSTAPKTDDELYTEALKRKVQPIIGENHPALDNDVAVMKKRLSTEHRQDLINAEARKDYGIGLYLDRKAEQVKNKVYAFFSKISPPAGSESDIQHDVEMKAHLVGNHSIA